jgi:hypothetical protein
MKVLIYSDAQATDGHERCFNDPTKPLQLWRIERMYDEIKRIYDEHKCQALWDLGDTTDDRTAIPVSVIDLLCDKLEPYSGEWNLKLVGNHEQYLRDTRIHAGKMFRRFFHVVETCESIKFGNVNILCVSYHDDVVAIVEFLRQAPRNKPAILIGHFQLVGCQMTSGTAITGVPKAALNFVEVGLLGHIHKPQSQGNIHYIGSPFQQHWGEAGENKRVAILDVGDHGISLEWVPLTGFPRYRQVTFEQFKECVKAESEDRYKVVLSSVEETEKFYAHPMANRADEAIYAYEQGSAVTVTQTGDVVINSKRDLLLRYMQKNPPSDLGLSIDDESMLELGEGITAHQ